MPQALDSGDRKLLIGAIVFLVLLLGVSALVSSPHITGESELPSSYSPAWGGTKGAFLLLQDLGYNVRRWERSPAEITGDPQKEVLILAEPSQVPSEDERDAIHDFLMNGGRVLATGDAAGQFLPDSSKFQEGYPLEENKQFDALVPSPLMRGAPVISMNPPMDWNPTSPNHLVVYGDEDTAAVVTYRYGKGRVVWWAAATPLTNGGILDADNLALFLNSVGPPGHVRILWDEYFHGVHGSLLSLFAHTPVLWGVAQFGLVFLAILATYSRRQSPVHLPAKRSRLHPLEFVETLGDLYASADAGSAAVRVGYQRFRFILTRKLGLPISVSVADLSRSASRSLAWEEESLFRTLTECERASQNSSLRGKEAVELMQKLFDYSARLEMRRADSQERQAE